MYQPTFENWSLLLVDDDEDEYLITGDILKDAKNRKIRLEWAPNYQAGLEKLRSDRYDAALIDYDLGACTGIEMIRELVGEGCTVPLILFTGRGNFEVDLEAMEAGATLYLTKGDINALTLERFIRYGIERKRIEKALNDNLRQQTTILESIQDGLFGLDRDWRFTYMNPPAGMYFGARPEDLLNRNIWQAFPGLSGTEIEAHFDRAMTGREPVLFTSCDELQERWYSAAVYPSDEGIAVYLQDISERKRVEDNLRKSEERFRTSFRSSPVAQAIARAADFVVLDLNDRFVETSGFGREEVIGRAALELGLYERPEDRKKLFDLVRAEGRIRNLELRVREKSGAVQTLLFSIEPIELGGEACYLLSGVDISGRKRMEEALQQSESRFRAIFERAEIGIAIGDLEGRVFESNAAFEDMLGYTREELRGMPFPAFTHPEDTVVELALVQEILAGKRDSYEVEKRYIRKDGAIIYVRLIGSTIPDAQGRPQLGIVLVEDITERRRAEAALRKSEEKFSKAFLSQPSILVIARAADGKIIEANPWGLELAGSSRAEVIGRTNLELGLAADLEEQRKLSDLVRSEERVRNHKYSLRKKSGETLELLLSVEPIELNGEAHVLITGVDITDRVRFEQELAQSNQELRQAQAALVNERNRLAAVMEALPIGVAILDEEGGNIQANRAFDEVWGRPRPEVDTIEDYEAYHARWVETGEAVKPEEWASARAVRTGETVRGQFLQIDKFDGTQATILNSAAPVRDPQGRIVGCAVAIMDITDRKNLP